MDYKVLIKLYVPEIEQVYELFIPVNKNIYQIKKLIKAILQELNMFNYGDENSYVMENRRTNKIYDNSEVIRNTDIRNGSELVIYKE